MARSEGLKDVEGDAVADGPGDERDQGEQHEERRGAQGLYRCGPAQAVEGKCDCDGDGEERPIRAQKHGEHGGGGERQQPRDPAFEGEGCGFSEQLAEAVDGGGDGEDGEALGELGGGVGGGEEAAGGECEGGEGGFVRPIAAQEEREQQAAGEVDEGLRRRR